MKRAGHRISIFFAAIFFSVIVFAAASQVQAETAFTMYIWEFGTRKGIKDEATRNLTQEFETAFIGTQCCTVLERRSYDRLMQQKENEKAVMSIDGIADTSVKTLKTLEAGAVLFGEVYDDVTSGEVKVSAIVQDFAGKSLVKQSIRFSRGKLSDAASREESMNALAEQVCSALVEAKIVKHAEKAEKAVAVNYSFAAYQAGDIVPELGKHNMIVNTGNGLALTSASSSSAIIALQGFSYRDNIELQLNMDLNGDRDGRLAHEIILWDRSRQTISLKIEGDHYYEQLSSLIFGDHKKKLENGGWKKDYTINNFKITIQDNLARFYLNDIFWGLQQVTFDTIDKITVAGIKRDQDFVYSISVTPMD